MTAAADFLDIEIVRESLIAVVNEMRANMIRASYSPIIYEGHDFSCCLMRGDGRQIALGRDDHPLHMLAVPVSTAAILEGFAGDIHPDDVFLHNDPYTGGTHLNDMLMLRPVFAAGQLVFFAAVRSHWNDVGGMTPGSLSGRVTDIYQEGMRVQPTKVVARGVGNAPFTELLFGNMRNAAERRGDFDSMLGVCAKAAARLEALAGKFGPRLHQAMDVMLARAERTMRDRIAGLPDGEYCAEGFLESNGHTPEPLAIRLRLTIAGETVVADFTGTSPQTAGPTNVGPAMAQSSVFSVLKAFLDPTTPINHGAYAPVRVVAPVGSFINARLPAPCGGMAEVKFGIDSVVAAALMQVPGVERVGDCKGTANHYHVAGHVAAGEGDPFILYEWPAGGTGGIAGMDGNNAVRTYLEGDFNSIQSAEVIEAGLPVRVESLAIREDSCGDGHDRGGFGLRRIVRLLAPHGQLSVLSERNRLGPYGVDGGGTPWPNRFTVHRGGAVLEPSPIPGKVSGFPLLQDDLVVVETSGGGGGGDPLTRDPDRVAHDVRQGTLTVDQAAARYGVVLVAGAPDAAATTELRHQLVQRRVFVRLQTLPTDIMRGTRRMLRVSPGTAAAARLTPDDVAELVPAQGACVRLWVECDPAIEDGVAMIGPGARAMLPDAASLWLRPL